jgi:cystathionine beta-lyase/cystathionine gamma-synthase
MSAPAPPGPGGVSPTTRALHVRASEANAGPAVTPVYRCSAFQAGSPYFYSRKDNPNISELEQVVCALEGARHAVAVSSGMSAIYMLLDLLHPGDLVVIGKLVYGCTYRMFHQLRATRGYGLEVHDLADPAVARRLTEGAALVFFETPTNPFLRTVDIARVAEQARSSNPDCLVVVDNTWATPLFQRPLDHGADISLHSGTKYFSGHSDAMNGVLVTNREDLHERFLETRFYGGMVLSPDTAWLVRRSLQTLEVRLERQQATTLAMRRFLEDRPEVAEVYYPAVDGSQLTGYGGILFFRLVAGLSYSHFADALRLFGSGTAMAAVTSTVAQPYTGSHASMTEDEKAGMGLGTDLVRLCFGLEHPDDLKADLRQAFERLGANSEHPAREYAPLHS